MEAGIHDKHSIERQPQYFMLDEQVDNLESIYDEEKTLPLFYRMLIGYVRTFEQEVSQKMFPQKNQQQRSRLLADYSQIYQPLQPIYQGAEGRLNLVLDSSLR